MKGFYQMATEVDVKALLQAGAHFGHKTSRWHPKMAPYIHSKRDGTHIIDRSIPHYSSMGDALTAFEEDHPYKNSVIEKHKK